MANAEPPSADAYIGSYISLISKSDIRYEGVLYNLNPRESTITLHNVKSFGTEGRKKEGPHVLASDRVYDYIFFRGSEVKDLHVISSPQVQSTPALPNDPAIIQCHYPPATSTPSSFSSPSPAPATNASSFTQYGLPNSSLQGNPAYNQSAGILGSWGSLASQPTGNCKEIARSACWPGHSGSSDGVSYVQEQSLLQTPRNPVPSSPIQQQQTQSSTMSASIAGDGVNFSVFSQPMLSKVSNGSSVTCTMPPLSNLSFSNPNNQYDAIPPKLSTNPMPSSASGILPTLPIISSSPSRDEPRSLSEPTLTCQSISPPVPSFVRSCKTVHSDTSTPSLSNAGHILQPGPIGHSLSQVHVAQKDIEVVQESTPKALPSKSECDMNPTERVQFIPKKLNGAAIPHHSTKHQAQERGKRRYVRVVNKPQKVGKYHRAVEKSLDGVALDNHHTCRDRGRGREIGRGDRGRARIIRPKINIASAHVYPNDNGHGQWRRKQVPSKIIKFSEDFDFEAMYEKFNKREIWGHLGKRNERIAEEEDEFEPLKFDSKPVYAKDDFFDTFSGNLPKNESVRGKSKISEQKKLDRETFGETYKYQRGFRGFGPSRGGRSRGSHSGRGNGRMVWVRAA